ncbi:hypothetical protein ES705_07227 [subsurface metagenome]
MEEWKITREEVKNEIYEEDRNQIEILKGQLENTIKLEDEATIYWQLSEKYKLLFWGYAEDFAIFANTSKKDFYKQLEKDYLWNCIYYREKFLQIIKQNNVIEANDGIFMDVGLKYRYFIKHNYDYEKIEEETFRFETFGNTSNEKINIIINDMEYAIRGMYYTIKHYEKENNHEELFCWCEVMGDLYLIIQLLLIQGGRTEFLDNARQSLRYYKDSREHLKFYAKSTIHYGGIYGLSYQTNFFDPFLKSFGFAGYILSGIEKMEFVEKNLLKKKSRMEYINYLDSSFPDNKTILNNRIEKLILKYPELKFKEINLEDWKIVLHFMHDHILSFNHEQCDLNNIIDSWKREDDMQKWLQLRMNSLLIEKRNEPSFYSIREGIRGGGSCDHTFKKIPICDKWKRDTNAKTYPVKINEFIDKAYRDHYEQVKSYADDVKLAVLIVVDSRDVIRNNNPDMVKECYDIKVNEPDGVITAIFVIQVSNTPPSRRK